MDKILLRNRGQMLRLARVLLRDDDEAYDVVADVTERALRTHPQGSESQLRHWMMQSVKNACMDHIRRLNTRERFQRLYTQDEAVDMSPIEERERLWKDIRRFIDSNLTEQERRVVLLRFDEELSAREIAQTLDISETAVYKHLAKALRRMRMYFNHED